MPLRPILRRKAMRTTATPHAVATKTKAGFAAMVPVAGTCAITTTMLMNATARTRCPRSRAAIQPSGNRQPRPARATLHRTPPGAPLTRADIEGLLALPRHLIDCDLEDANLSGLELTGWRFERCSLRRTDFSRARLETTLWTSCRGAFADFTECDLADAKFISCDFNNASLRRATLDSARIERCKLTGADLTEARAIDVIFDETLLVNARLAGHSFRKARLERIDFSQADLGKCDFRHATFIGCSLRDAHVQGARFDGADLRGADLGGLKLADARLFRGATISSEQAGQLLGELGLNVR